jgi:hypothetical protein
VGLKSLKNLNLTNVYPNNNKNNNKNNNNKNNKVKSKPLELRSRVSFFREWQKSYKKSKHRSNENKTETAKQNKYYSAEQFWEV